MHVPFVAIAVVQLAQLAGLKIVAWPKNHDGGNG